MTVSFLLEEFKACTHNRSIFTGMIEKWGGGVNSIVDDGWHRQTRQAGRRAWFVVSALGDPANQSLEISAFREVERRRVVRALSESPQDLSITPRIEGCVGHDLLEEVWGHKSRT